MLWLSFTFYKLYFTISSDVMHSFHLFQGFPSRNCPAEFEQKVKKANRHKKEEYCWRWGENCSAVKCEHLKEQTEFVKQEKHFYLNRESKIYMSDLDVSSQC